MGTLASQITSLTIVYSALYSSADQSKHQSSASLAFVWRIHRGPVNSPHKWPVTRKMSPFDDVIMSKWNFGVTQVTQVCGTFEARTILSSHQLLIIPTSNLHSIVMKYKWLEHFIVYSKLRVRNGLYMCLSMWLRCWFNFDLTDIKIFWLILKNLVWNISTLGSCGQCSANF